MSSNRRSGERQMGDAGEIKPAIPAAVLEGWAAIADILAGLLEHTVAFVMQGVGQGSEIVAVGREADDGHRPGPVPDRSALEHFSKVVARASDASAGGDRQTGTVTDIGAGQAFLGAPIYGPKGEIFGALVVQKQDEAGFPPAYQRLLIRFRNEIEHDVRLLFQTGSDMPRDDKRIETERRLGDDRFNLLLEHVADDFFVHDDQGRFLDVNHHVTLSTGFSREELLQMSVPDIVEDLDLEWAKGVWAEAEPGVAQTLYARHRRKDGSLFPVEVRLSCHLHQARKTFFATVRDISERIEAEDANRRHNAELEVRVAERTAELRKSTDLLQAVFDGTTDAIFLKDLEGRFVMLNQATARFLGRPAAEILERDLRDVVDPENAARILRTDREIMARGKAVTMEESFIVNGVRRHFFVTKVPRRDENGEVIGLIGVSRDVTDIRATETALRHSEARWEFALNGAGDGLWDWDLRTGHVFYSRQWKAMLGHAESEIGPTLNEFVDRIHPDDLQASWEAVERHMRGEAPDFVIELRMRAKDGSWRTILDRGKAIERDEDGSPLRIIGTHTDITARKQIEMELSARVRWLSEMMENLPIGAAFVTDDGILVNRAIEDLTGYGREELSKPDAWSRHFGDDLFEALASGENGDRAGRTYHTGQHSFFRKDGMLRLAEVAAARVGDHAIWLMRDVTDNKELEAQLSSLVDNLPHGAVYRLVQTPDGKLSLPYVSAGILALTGVPASEIMERRGAFTQTIHEDDLPRYNAMLEVSLSRGDVFDCQFRCRTRDGRVLWLHCRSGPRYQADGTVIWDGVMQDITARKQAEDLIVALKERMELAIRVGGVGIWDMNAQEQKYIWDDQMYVLYGLEHGAFDGSIERWLSLLHPDDVDRVFAQWQEATTETGAFESEFRIVHPSGAIRYIRGQAKVFRADDGSVLRALGINQDVTEERRTAQALIQARKAAEAAQEAKGEFLAVMSHEIRTPMNTVLGMTRLALQAEQDPRQRNYLEKISASAQTLTSILNDILDYSKIEAGKLELEESEFKLEAVLESVSAVTAMKAEEKGIEIIYAVAPDVPTRLVGDSLRLGQVLINLVNNAVKFTHKGEIVVSVDVEQATATNAIRLQFAVQDTGIGLDADQVAGLFQAFTQAEKHVSRQYGGTGLGLAICKRLVEGMNGQIWVSSTLGKGSTFYFTVEFRSPQRAASYDGVLRSSELKGKRVLIVDDNASARETLAGMVHDFGMETHVVGSGKAALTALSQACEQQRPFEVVLMDWRMPGMDGLETAGHIKNDARLKSTPAVLMVTAYGREEVLRRAEQLGLHGVLVKPVTVSVMFNTIVGVFHGTTSKAATALDEQADRVLPPQPQDEFLEALAGRHILVVDDNAFNREVVGDFLQLAGMRVDTAVNGLDALEKLETATYDAVLMDVHMPEMDGLTATRRIRAQERWASLPLIALTAQALTKDREASLAAGMNAHLTKPIDETALFRTLADLLPAPSPSQDSEDGQAPRTAQADGGQDIFASVSGADLSAAQKRLGGSRERLQRLLQGFVRDFREAPAQLHQSALRGDTGAVAALAHAVRGAASYLDAQELCAAAADIEEVSRRGDLDELRLLLPAFRDSLAVLLGQLDRLATEAVAGRAEPGHDGLRKVIGLIAAAKPLLQSGDYAAYAILDQIIAELSGSVEIERARAILGHFEELELAEAENLLQQLHADLEQQVFERSQGE
ncbi:PAS domain S-box protein [Labrys sp. LIt4]|uniref:PAS domain S-box protein n=1 Tax=Labrys sp. LIt4 TaxID=2821355 RepID=UPI0032AFD48B